MSRIRVKLIVIGFLVTVLVGAGAIGAGLSLKAESAKSNCESVNEVRLTLQNILIRSQVVASQNPDFTEAEKDAAEKFYSKAISELQPQKC